MSSINTSSDNGILGALGSSYQLQGTNKTDRTELGQEQFLMLMITQFRNQDPLKPQDPSEFLSQLAEVSNVAGIAEMNRSVTNLADSLYAGQALQAASVVGRSVLAPSEDARLEPDGIVKGAVDLPASTQTGFVRVLNGNGSLVREIPLGLQSAGLANFEWDGTNASGQRVAPGDYRFAAGFRNGAEETAADILLAKRVTSVSLGGDGRRTEITTEDQQTLALSDVRAIY
jgi:flagellar basal-body rod modification protein FlgD